jgi:hypothetical protein
VAQATKVAWAVVAALIVVLILGAFVAPAGVAAKADNATPADLVATRVHLEYAQYRGRGGTTALGSLAMQVRVDYEQYRGRGGFSRTSPVAENPELVYARAYSEGQGTGLAQSSGAVACVLDLGYATLAANPELMYPAIAAAQAAAPGQAC